RDQGGRAPFRGATLCDVRFGEDPPAIRRTDHAKYPRLGRSHRPAVRVRSARRAPTPRRRQGQDTRVYELRTYYAAPDKLDALNDRFREHTVRLFEKHGITNVGYWVPVDNPDNKLIYLLSYPSREAREKSWQEFLADPDWQKAQKDSEVNGKLVA